MNKRVCSMNLDILKHPQERRALWHRVIRKTKARGRCGELRFEITQEKNPQ